MPLMKRGNLVGKRLRRGCAAVLGQCIGMIAFSLLLAFTVAGLDRLYRSGTFGAALRSAGTVDHIALWLVVYMGLPACLVGGAWLALLGRMDAENEKQSSAAVDAFASTMLVIALYLLMRFVFPEHRAAERWFLPAFLCAAPFASILGTFLTATARADKMEAG